MIPRCALLLVASLVSVLFLACGGTDNDSAAPVGAEDERARSMLLTVQDFPAGWAEKPRGEVTTGAAVEQCNDLADIKAGRTGYAMSGSFSEGRSDLDHAVGIYESPEQAAAAVGRAAARGDCLAKAINAGKLNDDEFKFSDASFSRLSFDKYGDRTESFRMEFRARPASGGLESTLYFDSVYVLVGRVRFVLSASETWTPYRADELEKWVEKATARARERQ